MYFVKLLIKIKLSPWFKPSPQSIYKIVLVVDLSFLFDQKFQLMNKSAKVRLKGIPLLLSSLACSIYG